MMKKTKGFMFSISILLLILVTVIFIKEHISYSKNISKVKQVTTEEKIKETTENKKETKSTQETNLSSSLNLKDPYENLIFEAGEVNSIIRNEEEYTGEKVVFLTFDDGLDNISTPRIMDILKEHEVPATFFLQGQYINENTKDILLRMYSEGHCIAAHSFGHDYSFLYPGRVGNTKNILSDFNKIQERASLYLGEDFNFHTWRYPGGHMSWSNLEEADRELKALGVDWIDWNNMTGDAEPKSRRPSNVNDMVNKVKILNEASSNNMQVILMHDSKNKELTIEALPQVIAYFKDLDYKFGKFK
ncbi:MAG: polysaccharide deacetylase family protein [Lagierella massiliensis]|nr:polysaccharide deacetylase family protein [Lagierella massiliensis]